MAKTAKYWIYIIPDYQWKDGSIGKIGVTSNPPRRAKDYKLESLTILEEYTNIKEVSKREIELQKQYGFKVDNREYWKTKEMQKKSVSKEANEKRIKSNQGRKMDLCNTPEAITKRVKLIKKPILQYDLEGNLVNKWDSAVDAAIELLQIKNCQSNIIQCCKGKIKTYKNFIWKYA